jgi:hypothetical protein
VLTLNPTVLIAVTLAFAYAWGVTAMLALQNRSPQSTFAWADRYDSQKTSSRLVDSLMRLDSPLI